MAEGQSNAGIAKALWITHGAVEKHIKHIFSKLGIPAHPRHPPARPRRHHLPRSPLALTLAA